MRLAWLLKMRGSQLKHGGPQTSVTYSKVVSDDDSDGDDLDNGCLV